MVRVMLVYLFVVSLSIQLEAKPLELHLEDTVITQVDDDQQLSLIVYEKRETEIRVPFNVGGAPQLKSMTRVTISKAPGRTMKVKVEDVVAWDKQGNRVEMVELTERLEKPTAIFQLRDAWPEGDRIREAQKGVLRDDLLFLYSPVTITEVRR